MKPSPNPVHKQGAKNIDCTYYGQCLNYAVEHRWQFWTCSRCPYKFRQQSVNLVRTVDDPDLTYELPPKLSKEIWHKFG